MRRFSFVFHLKGVCSLVFCTSTQGFSIDFCRRCDCDTLKDRAFHSIVTDTNDESWTNMIFARHPSDFLIRKFIERLARSGRVRLEENLTYLFRGWFVLLKLKEKKGRTINLLLCSQDFLLTSLIFKLLRSLGQPWENVLRKLWHLSFLKERWF